MSLLLAVDVGNTNLVMGVFDVSKAESGGLLHAWRLATSRERTVDEYGLSTLALLRHAGLEATEIKAMVISSVVPPLHPVLEAWARVYFKQEPLWIEPGIRSGLKISIENPAELGADRLVNAVAGVAKYGAPLIAVDFGTATTIKFTPDGTLVDANGNVTQVRFKRADGSEGAATGRIFVLAAHAIEGPKLLQMSRTDALPNGVANSSGMVGRHLMDHPIQLSWCVTGDPIFGYRGPLSTSGIEKRAVSAAMRRSHAAATTSPPPTHQPCRRATVTARVSSSARAMRQPTCRSSIGADWVNADRSAPAEKARPAPLTTTTFRSWCSSNQRAASSISCNVWLLSGFSFSGRFSCSEPRGPSTVATSVSKFAVSVMCPV